ncbi:hypothetical protein chiPu_0026194, partial [Chiloscyllium punctatum]|nr:hypothetical protein [Chiloscyllium punctatum]
STSAARHRPRPPVCHGRTTSTAAGAIHRKGPLAPAQHGSTRLGGRTWLGRTEDITHRLTDPPGAWQARSPHAVPRTPRGGRGAAAGGRGSGRFPRLRGCGEGYYQGAITLATRSSEPHSKATGLPSRPEAGHCAPPAEEMRPATAMPMPGAVPAEEIRQTPT